jgi:hypothetical protein
MLAPVLSEKTILLMVVFSLVFLSITQGVFLLLIKGFLAAFFTSADAENIRLGNLVPETMRQWIPAFEQLTISRSFLSVLVPVGIVVAGILKAFATYLYNLGIFRLSREDFCRCYGAALVIFLEKKSWRVDVGYHGRCDIYSIAFNGFFDSVYQRRSFDSFLSRYVVYYSLACSSRINSDRPFYWLADGPRRKENCLVYGGFPAGAWSFGRTVAWDS